MKMKRKMKLMKEAHHISCFSVRQMSLNHLGFSSSEIVEDRLRKNTTDTSHIYIYIYVLPDQVPLRTDLVITLQRLTAIRDLNFGPAPWTTV